MHSYMVTEPCERVQMVEFGTLFIFKCFPHLGAAAANTDPCGYLQAFCPCPSNGWLLA